jgi:hypothetical protein
VVRETGERFVARARRWALDLPPVALLTGGFLVVLLVSGLFGGLREVDTDPAGTVTAGVPVETEPLTVTVKDAYWVTAFPEAAASPVDSDGSDSAGGSDSDRRIYPDEPTRGRFVVVEATVLNTSDETVDYDVLREAVSLDGAQGFVTARDAALVPAAQARPTYVYTMPEKRIFGTAQPGVTYTVAYLWDQSAAVALPQRLTVAVNGHTWREDTLDFHLGWKDPAVEATGPFAVPERRAS